MKVLAIIPARYNSTRFRGKPIRAVWDSRKHGDSGLLSMIELVYRQVEKSLADDVIVATDDKRIFEKVQSFGGKVIMTEMYHKTGTERLLEVIQHPSIIRNQYDSFINVQGDEPFIDPAQINEVIKMMKLQPYSVATLHAKCDSIEQLMDHNIVKQVITHENVEEYGRVLYSSRTPIPWPGIDGENFKNHNYYIHIGIYGFPEDVIARLDLDWQPPLQIAENLEQLNWASMGIDMHSRLSTWNIGINTIQDLKDAGGIVIDEIPWCGCTEEASYNYDKHATQDDGTCEPFPQVPKRWKEDFDMLSNKDKIVIYDEYTYYLTSATSKYYPMNTPRKIELFWKTRNFSMDIDDKDY